MHLEHHLLLSGKLAGNWVGNRAARTCQHFKQQLKPLYSNASPISPKNKFIPHAPGAPSAMFIWLCPLVIQMRWKPMVVECALFSLSNLPYLHSQTYTYVTCLSSGSFPFLCSLAKCSHSLLSTYYLPGLCNCLNRMDASLLTSFNEYPLFF